MSAPVQGPERLGLFPDICLALSPSLKAGLPFQGNGRDTVFTGTVDMAWLVLTPTEVPESVAFQPPGDTQAQGQRLRSQKFLGSNPDSTT